MSGTARLYTRFAEQEARGESPVYEALASAPAADDQLVALVATLPPHRRRPNLVLAAIRLLGGPVAFAGPHGQSLEWFEAA